MTTAHPWYFACIRRRTRITTGAWLPHENAQEGIESLSMTCFLPVFSAYRRPEVRRLPQFPAGVIIRLDLRGLFVFMGSSPLP
jgi:hypothetical protein